MKLLQMESSKSISNELLLAEASLFLAEGKDVIIKTKGSSMLPFIRGDRDSVRLRKSASVAVGDIVLAEIRPGCYVLHRIVAVKGESVTLMGDGNLKCTESCRISDVKGTVVEILDENEQPRRLTNGSVWRRLLPFRRIILGIYRRII